MTLSEVFNLNIRQLINSPTDSFVPFIHFHFGFHHGNNEDDD